MSVSRAAAAVLICVAAAGASLAAQAPTDAPPVATSSADVEGIESPSELEQLPTNGRHVLDFALLASWVTRDARAGDLSFDGQRGTLNGVLVDGVDATSSFFAQPFGRAGAGLAPYQFSLDTVQQVSINAAPYSARFGRGAANIEVVTKSGGNRLAGSAFWFVRDDALSSPGVADAGRPGGTTPAHADQFGGTLGGPLRRDRLFFFAAYDGQRHEAINPVIFDIRAGLPPFAPTLATIEHLAQFAVDWPLRRNQDVVFARVDGQLGVHHRLTVRFNQQDFVGVNTERSGPAVLLSHTGGSQAYSRSTVATLASTLRPSLRNELRIQAAREHDRGASNSDGPELLISDRGTLVVAAGRPSDSPRDTRLDRWQFVDTATWTGGAHTLAAGIDVEVDRVRHDIPAYQGGSYRYADLTTFYYGLSTGYRQAFPIAGSPGTATHPDSTEAAAFLQHTWRATPELTVGAGLRVDSQRVAMPGERNPSPLLAQIGVATDRGPSGSPNWAPRLEAQWSPSGSPFVVRGGYGVFYGRTPGLAVAAAQVNDGLRVATYGSAGPFALLYPATLTAPPAGPPPIATIVAFDAQYESPRVQKASVELERRLGRDAAASVSWRRARGDHLTRPVNARLRDSGLTRSIAIAGGGTLSYRPAGFLGFFDVPGNGVGRIVTLSSTGESSYDGLTVEAHGRARRDLVGRVGYTWSRVVDTMPDAVAVQSHTIDDALVSPNAYGLEGDRARGDDDRPHRFVASGFYTPRGRDDGVAGHLTRGWTLSGILRAESGRPYSGYIDYDLNGDGNARNDVPFGRNAFRMPRRVVLDARIARDLSVRRVRLTLIAEAFNLLNHADVTVVNTRRYVHENPTRTSPEQLRELTTFGAIVADSPRVGQLAIRARF
jgi:hypothetical protein